MNTKQVALLVVVNISGGVNALVRHAQTEANQGSMLQMNGTVCKPFDCCFLSPDLVAVTDTSSCLRQHERSRMYCARKRQSHVHSGLFLATPTSTPILQYGRCETSNRN